MQRANHILWITILAILLTLGLLGVVAAACYPGSFYLRCILAAFGVENGILFAAVLRDRRNWLATYEGE